MFKGLGELLRRVEYQPDNSQEQPAKNSELAPLGNQKNEDSPGFDQGS